MQWGRERTHGRVRYVDAVFTIDVGEPGQWRLRRALSGGDHAAPVSDAAKIREQPGGRMDFLNEHHQRAQMEALGALFLDPRPLPAHISGAEGLQDVRILIAIHEAARTGCTVRIG